MVGFYSLATDTSPISDTVVLLRNGEAKKSTMSKMGAYCTVGWYRSIENLLVKRDGTITNSPFNYKWTLNEFGSDLDKTWFDANCKEPPN